MKTRGLLIGIILAALVWGAVSCSNPPTKPAPPVQVGMHVDFKPSALATLIDSAVLRVFYPGAPEPLIEYPTVSDGMIRDTLILAPGDSVEFDLSAMSAQGRVLYRGTDIVNIVPGERVTVQIYMEPVVSMLRPSPLYQTISLAAEGQAAVGIELYNVNDLYGISFRLLYDTTQLAVTAVELDPLLADDIFALVLDTLDYVAVGLTRTTDVPVGEFSGSPRLVTIYFSGVTAGTSALSFDNERAVLTDQGGQLVPEMSQMVFETGEILVGP